MGLAPLSVNYRVIGLCLSEDCPFFISKFLEITHNCMEKDLYPKTSNFLVGSLAAFIAPSCIDLHSIHKPTLFQLHCFNAVDGVLEENN